MHDREFRAAGGPAEARRDDLRDDPALAPMPPRVEREHPSPAISTGTMDRYLAIQRPVVLAQIRRLRRKHPDATPAELLRRIELQFLNTVTATGGGTGAAAVVPGIGTAASLAISGAETIAFLEMTALYGQAVAELHGLALADPVRARTLVQSLIVGEVAKDIITQLAGQVTGKGPSKQDYWGELVARGLPRVLVSDAAVRIRDAFLRRFVASATGRTLGRIIPFGVGAVVGGAGNRMLAKRIVRNAAEAFGPVPASFPLDLHPDALVREDDSQRSALEMSKRGPFAFFRLPRHATMAELEP
ncbi:hypothetical protein GCM10011490_07060 [Pseudoclavibacter endophyticus]|uniref:EcsC family protein n=1 Tax=Pseudoclavibacter endophyticus TaxID=1778590 RepID=A0A6H9WFS0_9MICO|nr:hypothetical protein [Pseudoclavibacter endophyticus]KAB1649809.1 hypothetical protein F8O04_06145 [Pseudoclavibacter endophyticus]GGA59584.1 hypothetical protein GCM10011490_07060 [Pseudoclavibacter endophyticus]